MTSLTLVLFLLMCNKFFIAYSNFTVSKNFIVDFFNYKNVHVLHLKTCDSLNDKKVIKLLGGDFFFTMNLSLPYEHRFRRRYYRIGVFVDLSCRYNLEFIERATSLKWFSISFEWLIWLRTIEDITFLESSGISISSQVTAIVSGQVLYDLYRSYVTDQLIKLKVGVWSPEDGLQYNKEPRVYDFHKGPILGGLFIYNQGIFDRSNLTDQFQDNSYEPNEDILNRYFYDFHLHLADFYNYSLVMVETDNWANPKPGGHYGGLVGQLEYSVVNISVGHLFLMANRTTIMDHLPPMLEYWMPCAFRQPRALGTYKALSLPFEPNAWVTVGIVLLLATFCFYRICRNIDKNSTFSESLIIFIGVFAQQGLTSDPRSISGGVICLTMLLTSIFVMFYYNAGTMSALLTSTPPKINKLDQLLESKIPVNLISAPYFNLKAARRLLLSKEVRDKVDKSSKRTYNLEEGLQIVLEGGAFCAAFFTVYEGIDKTFKDSQKCDLTFIPSFRPAPIASLLPKNSPLREIFAIAFLRLLEHGLATRQRNKWIAKQPKCAGKEQFLFVSLEAVTIAMGTLAAGGIFSVVILIIEILFNKKVKMQGKIRNKPYTIKSLKHKHSLPVGLPSVN